MLGADNLTTFMCRLVNAKKLANWSSEFVFSDFGSRLKKLTVGSEKWDTLIKEILNVFEQVYPHSCTVKYFFSLFVEEPG